MTKEAGKKVPFLWNAERRRSIWDWLCPAFLNAVLLNRSIQDLIQIYGQSLRFWRFVRKQNAFYGQTGIFQWFVRKFLPIMMRIYGQSRLFLPILSVIAILEQAIYGQSLRFCRFVRKRQWFCQMQRLLNHHSKISFKFTSKLFLVISIMEM